MRLRRIEWIIRIEIVRIDGHSPFRATGNIAECNTVLGINSELVPLAQCRTAGEGQNAVIDAVIKKLAVVVEGLGNGSPGRVDLKAGSPLPRGREVRSLERLAHINGAFPTTEAVIASVTMEHEVAPRRDNVMEIRIFASQLEILLDALAQLSLNGTVRGAARSVKTQPDEVNLVGLGIDRSLCRIGRGRRHSGDIRFLCRLNHIGRRGAVGNNILLAGENRILRRPALGKLRFFINDNILDSQLVGIRLGRSRTQRARGRDGRQAHRREQECREDGDDAARPFLMLHIDPLPSSAPPPCNQGALFP